MSRGHTLELDALGLLATFPLYDLRIPFYIRHVVVIGVVVAHCDDVGHLRRRRVVQSEDARGVRVGHDPEPAFRG